MQDSSSFWSDIKELGEQLAKTPDSLCFARLSDVYLKVGLLDDALQVARQGVSKFPRYLSGQRALALACHAKGYNDEAIAALLTVTEALPEDVPSQRILGRLLMDAGDQESACNAFRTALEFAPDDVESRMELESCERSAQLYGTSIESDDEIIEDLEILEEIEVLEEDESESDSEPQVASLESVTVHDPLSTSTLAELYVSQGFVNKALEIYRAIMADHPEDLVTARRVAELEVLDSGALKTVSEIDDTGVALSAEGFVAAPSDVLTFTENIPESVPQIEGETEYDSQQCSANVSSWQQEGVQHVPQQGIADNALAVLDGWLENIRRIKSCR